MATKSLTKSLNSFAYSLYNLLSSGKDENFFISPSSISTALTMTFAGARNETADQLKSLLHLQDYNEQQIYELNNNYITQLNNLGSDIKLSIANKIFPHTNFEIKKEFIFILSQHFKSGILNLNYSDTTGSADKINSWVEQETNGKIKNLISSDSLSNLTKLILVNAIYFKGNWDIKFDSNMTSKEDFYLNDGTKKQVDMMKLFGKKFIYHYEPFSLPLTAVQLPYIGKSVSMTIILPNEGVKLNDIEGKLNAEIISSIVEAKDLIEDKVDIFIPKFKLEYERKLEEDLVRHGCEAPFNPLKADLSGSHNSPESLYISSVIHKAVVEVNEEGTEAAAATAVVIRKKCMALPAIEFVCNKPFMFIIHEKINHSVLFIGKYVNPSA